MTEIEATALLLVLGSGGLCVRFELGPDGAIRHAPEPEQRTSSPRVATAMMAAAAIGVAACGPVAAAPRATPPVASVSPPDVVPPIPAAPTPLAVAPVAVVDSDGDGVPDAEDACPMEAGRKLDAPARNGCPTFVGVVSQGAIVVLEQIRFTPGARAIDARGQRILEEVARLLRTNPDITKIAVEGHASLGEPNPEKLGKARAEAVVAALRKLEVEPARLVAESYGSDRPIADNATQAGREKNRRAEFKVLSSTSCPTHGATPSVASP